MLSEHSIHKGLRGTAKASALHVTNRSPTQNTKLEKNGSQKFNFDFVTLFAVNLIK